MMHLSLAIHAFASLGEDFSAIFGAHTRSKAALANLFDFTLAMILHRFSFILQYSYQSVAANHTKLFQ